MPLSEEAARIQAAVRGMSIREFHHFRVDGMHEVFENPQEAASAAFRKGVEAEIRRWIKDSGSPDMTAMTPQAVAGFLDDNFHLLKEMFQASAAARVHYKRGA